MKQRIIAKTKYDDKHWLVWLTGFNDGFKKLPLILKEELKNDIQVILEDNKGNRLGDAICHYGGYGVENGEWEVMNESTEEIIGHLTFKEVLKYFNSLIKTQKKEEK